MRSMLAGWLPENEAANDAGPDLAGLNRAFAAETAPARVAHALRILPGPHVVSSSFGAQSAVMLHLVTREAPGIPVVLVDTGYLFPETYRFIDALTTRLRLNLHTVRSDSSPAWQETRWGRLWEQGLDGIERYNHFNKVEPMQRALAQLGAATWFSGLRRQQSQSRADVAPVEFKGARYKVHPLFDWSDRDVHRYLEAHNLPYHPLREKGYLSIGDWHTTRSLAEAGNDSEGLRFFGLKRECGLHEG
jgi:phosphoadenosine phosphosulfate reductase